MNMTDLTDLKQLIAAMRALIAHVEMIDRECDHAEVLTLGDFLDLVKPYLPMGALNTMALDAERGALSPWISKIVLNH